MPIRNDSDLARIIADLAKAKRRLAESELGQHIYGAASGIPAELAGAAHGANVRNLYATIERLESEYVNAMLAERQWSHAGIIEAMSRPKPEVNDDEESGEAPDSGARIGSDASQDTSQA